MLLVRERLGKDEPSLEQRLEAHGSAAVAVGQSAIEILKLFKEVRVVGEGRAGFDQATLETVDAARQLAWARTHAETAVVGIRFIDEDGGGRPRFSSHHDDWRIQTWGRSVLHRMAQHDIVSASEP